MNFERRGQNKIREQAVEGVVRHIQVQGRAELWCVCEVCGKKLLHVDGGTRIAGLTVKCRGCGAFVRVSVGE